MDIRKVLEVSEDDFQKTVLENPLPVAVLFYSDDCPICQSIFSLFSHMAGEFSEQMLFVKVNRDYNRNLAKKYRVRASSTILFFRQGDEFCKRLSGYIRRPDFLCIVREVIEKKCECLSRNKVECDVLILGGGPAGLTSAIYTARSRLYTVVVDDNYIGGQVATKYHVANYPGTNGVIRGIDLVNNMKRQAMEFGAQIDDMQDITGITLPGGLKKLETEKTDYFARAVIIATGASPRKLNVEGEETFTGRGVHYCAACDAALYQDAHLIVVGGGDSAVEEAVFLTRFAKKVTVVHRSAQFTATKYAQDELFKNKSIEVLFNTEVIRIYGEDFVTGVMLRDNVSKQERSLAVDGVFIYIGTRPQSKLFEGQLPLNDQGYILTDNSMQTPVEGVFAAGDVRAKELRQIATAVGDGAVAAVAAGRYINNKFKNEEKES